MDSSLAVQAKIVEATGELIDDGSELFSLSGLATVQDLARVNEAPVPGIDDLRLVEKDSDADGDDESASDSEDDEDQRKLELLQEEYLEESYNRFMAEKVLVVILFTFSIYEELAHDKQFCY